LLPSELQNITPVKTGKSKAFTAILHFDFLFFTSDFFRKPHFLSKRISKIRRLLAE